MRISSKERRTIRFTADTVHERDPNGDFLIEQVYVQYFIPAEQTFPHPLVLIHGGGLTDACWETTPDGRPPGDASPTDRAILMRQARAQSGRPTHRAKGRSARRRADRQRASLEPRNMGARARVRLIPSLRSS